jgi:hypothetical protein
MPLVARINERSSARQLPVLRKKTKAIFCIEALRLLKFSGNSESNTISKYF